jgi:hypothetical protein
MGVFPRSLYMIRRYHETVLRTCLLIGALHIDHYELRGLIEIIFQARKGSATLAVSTSCLSLH